MAENNCELLIIVKNCLIFEVLIIGYKARNPFILWQQLTILQNLKD